MQKMREIHDVPAKRFGRVRFKCELYDTTDGVITGAGKKTLRVRVQDGGVVRIVNFYPHELEYLAEGAA